ncbi:MAG: hypothetical protein AAF679_14915, partial [Pseudomonadota bacterium]
MSATALLPANSADFSDPTWPCVQRKVERLSLGLMWPFVVDPDAPAPEESVAKDIKELGDTLALRRIELEDITDTVGAFAARHNGDPEVLGQVFSHVFDTLSKRRSRIINGIGSFSLGQIALAEKIDAARLEMDALMAAEAPDFDRVDALEEQLDWDQLIYTDR